MKTIFTSFILLALTSIPSLASTPFKIESKIEHVTVFMTGGEINRKTKVGVKTGRNTLIFTGISSVIDAKSIQFYAQAPFHLVSISTEMDYLHARQNNENIQALKDSLSWTQNQIKDLKGEKNAYTEEKDLILTNKNIKGGQQNLTVDELKSMADFYRSRLMEINKKLNEYNSQIRNKELKLVNYKNQLIEANYKAYTHSNQIIVVLDSDIDQTLNTELKYVVSNCGWQANYDLSTTDTKDIIHLKYKAKVYNDTGNDWNEIDMTLSTANPILSASVPTLTPWFINGNDYSSYRSKGKTSNAYGWSYLEPNNRSYSQYYDNSTAPEMSDFLDVYSDSLSINQLDANFINQKKKAKNKVNITNIEVPQLSSEFIIQDKYSIPSNAKPHLVEVTEHELKTTFSHKSVPKLDKDAFLLANVVDWEKYQLIPGPTNVYHDNNYVGQSFLNPNMVEDTLRLSFGRNHRISIKRNLITELSEKKVIGGNRKDSYMYEITIKNNQSTAINIDIFDQIPISTVSDISITTDELSEGQLNSETGIVRWILQIPPSQVQTLKIGYTIKYPKNKPVQAQTYRTISCPSF